MLHNMVLCCSVTTAAVPVHVDTSPPIDVSSEENFISELIEATLIVERLKDTSPAVIQLMSQLRENLIPYDQSVIQDQLKQHFEAALYQGGVPPEMVPQLALMFAHNTVNDIRMV